MFRSKNSSIGGVRYIDFFIIPKSLIDGGGFVVAFLAIGAGAAAGVAIYEAGRYTGAFIKNHILN